MMKYLSIFTIMIKILIVIYLIANVALLPFPARLTETLAVDVITLARTEQRTDTYNKRAEKLRITWSISIRRFKMFL